MPFEPLLTDEELSSPAKQKKDFEAQLMAGCVTIGVVSLTTYVLTVWPFAVLPEYTVVGLLRILAMGALPASVFGAVAGRRFALAGASGFFGGAMAAAVFMHLRLQQTLLGNYTKDIPKPEYPDFVAWALPVSWFLWAGLVAWVFCRREPSQG
jgi:branched-subunit amino acid transport protein AzlD